MSAVQNKPRSAGRRLTVVRVGKHMGGDHYKVGECSVLQTAKTHFSISHPTRDPRWEEIAAARYALLPRLKDCVMLLPPDDEYINAHEHCFHVHLLRALAPGGWAHNAEAW